MRASLLSYLILLWGLAGSAWLLGEPITPWLPLGVALVAAGILVSNRSPSDPAQMTKGSLPGAVSLTATRSSLAAVRYGMTASRPHDEPADVLQRPPAQHPANPTGSPQLLVNHNITYMCAPSGFSLTFGEADARIVFMLEAFLGQ